MRMLSHFGGEELIAEGGRKKTLMGNWQSQIQDFKFMDGGAYALGPTTYNFYDAATPIYVFSVRVYTCRHKALPPPPPPPL